MKWHRFAFIVQLVAACPGLLAADAAAAQDCVVTLQNPTTLEPTSVFGLYTDRPSYSPGETISVLANWPSGTNVKYRVVRLGKFVDQTAWPELRPLANAPVITYATEQAPPYGSFVEYPSAISLAGLPAFTLEGWIRPTWTTGQATILAGQSTAAGGGIAALGIDAQGRLRAMCRNQANQLAVATDPTPLAVDRWHFVAVTYDGASLKLFKGLDPDEADLPSGTQRCVGLVHQATLAGTVRNVSGFPFRIGASKDAPGPDTGCYDGRVDRLTAWRTALTIEQLQTSMNGGSATPSTCSFATVMPPATQKLLSALFEDAYGASVANGANPAQPGTIVNHGTPGVEGRTGTRALRLNRDQVVDAQFDWLDADETGGAPQAAPVEHIAVPAGLNQSGIYAVHAVFEEAGGYNAHSAVNKQAAHYAAFAIRPPAESTPGRPIAVVFPSFTWMVYNAWPGAMGFEYAAGFSAPGLAARPAPLPGQLLPQGCNGPYRPMGDGISPVYFTGWKRPNLRASPARIPFDTEFTNALHCPLDVKLLEWLENPTGHSAFGYHAFTDHDLHDGSLSLVTGGATPAPRYAALLLVGHNEYWSRAMLDNVHAYLEAGGNVINVAGNSLGWRVALDAGSGVLEARKWAPGFTSMRDVSSLMEPSSTPTSLMGAWRFVQQCQTGQPVDDYVLGAITDIVQNDDRLSDLRGVWKVAANHWLWDNVGGSGPALDECLTAVGRMVGNEVDAYIESSLDCGALPGDDPPQTIPSVFPFSAAPASVTILARGSFPYASWGATRWYHPAFDKTTFAEIAATQHPPYCNIFCGIHLGNAAQPTDACAVPQEPHGTIVYYKHRGGGRVLNLAAIESALGLKPAVSGPGSNALSDLVARMLDCNISGGCGD